MTDDYSEWLYLRHNRWRRKGNDDSPPYKWKPIELHL